MKPKTLIPPEEQKPGFSVHNRVPEADEESRERPATAASSDYKENYTAALFVRK